MKALFAKIDRRLKIIIAISLAVSLTVGVVLWALLGINDDTVDEPSSVVAPSQPSSTFTLADNPIDFAALTEQNPDICGWLTVPNTNINYPILQSKEPDDNDFYLTHDVDRKYTIYGSIYIQRENSPLFIDRNTVIYGHNMRDGSMFRHLHKFREADFFEQNEYFTIYLKGHIKTYRIFSAYRYDNRHILNSFNFNDTAVYEQYLAFAQNPDSPIKNVRQGVEVTTKDKIVTLSTCISDDRYRYLVQGVLISDQRTH